jgi:hypothetical protein
MKKLLTSIVIILSLYSCSSGEKDFMKWGKQNNGKMFTAEIMNDLISKFGPVVDTVILNDNDWSEGMDWSYDLFLGPDFDSEKGKELFYMARAEQDSLSKWFYKHMKETGDEQGLKGDQRYSDLNYEYKNSTKVFIEDFYKKWETIYFEKGGRKTLKFSELVNSYNKKFPDLNLDQCIDSLTITGKSNFGIPVTTPDYGKPEKLNFSARDTGFLFLIEKSVSYKKIFGFENREKGDDYKDFKIYLTSVVYKLKNGTVDKPMASSDNGHGITEDSKTEFENILIGEWVCRDYSQKIIAKLNYFKNGTYTYSTTLLGGINKKGKWRINRDGEIVSTNQDGNMTITNSGIRIGSTIYKKN